MECWRYSDFYLNMEIFKTFVLQIHGNLFIFTIIDLGKIVKTHWKIVKTTCK